MTVCIDMDDMPARLCVRHEHATVHRRNHFARRTRTTSLPIAKLHGIGIEFHRIHCRERMHSVVDPAEGACSITNRKSMQMRWPFPVKSQIWH